MREKQKKKDDEAAAKTSAAQSKAKWWRLASDDDFWREISLHNYRQSNHEIESIKQICVLFYWKDNSTIEYLNRKINNNNFNDLQ